MSSSSMSQFSWLDHLNTVDQQGSTPPNVNGNDAGALSEDLRSQLEAWTTVAFGDDALNGIPSSFSSSDLDESAGPEVKSVKLDVKDPSPYAKRPFGQFNHNHSLERGFNAFNPSSAAFDNSSTFSEIYAGLGFSNIDGMTAADGSNALFAAPVSLSDAPVLGPSQQHFTVPAPVNHENQVSAPPAKKQRLSDALPSSIPSTPSSLSSSSTTHAASPAIATGSTSKIQQTILTKAALLAAQAAELAAKKGVTPEEEAARQAELNRIAAEDDKRRRNTAASARFRVKKKQREAALEDTVKGLNDKIEKLEKDLEASKAENTFLRDLVIRKVGLSDLPGSASGRISGGQEGTTGMGTRPAF